MASIQASPPQVANISCTRRNGSANALSHPHVYAWILSVICGEIRIMLLSSSSSDKFMNPYY